MLAAPPEAQLHRLPATDGSRPSADDGRPSRAALRARAASGGPRHAAGGKAKSGRLKAARERLSVLEREADGFEIAEADLRLRGPGEILGVRQAGAGGRLLIGAGADRDLLDGAIAAARQLADDGVDVSFWEHLGSSLVLPMSLPEDAV